MMIYRTKRVWLVACLAVLFVWISTSFADDAVDAVQKTEKPSPGKQVVQEFELPASTSQWNYSAEKMKNIGESRPVDTSKKDTIRYWIYLPQDYERYLETASDSAGAPLFLFLHGAGERGNEPGDIDKVKVHGPPKLLDDPVFQQRWPCVTVSPQCKNDFAWSPEQLMLLLDHIEANYKIDKRRIYVSGISMGGFGTWMCLQLAPERFAAAAPICGGCKLEYAEKLADIPIWNFHGTKDGAVPFSFSEAIINAIKKAGGRKIIFTVYPGAGHDVWTETYNNRLLYDWLFSHEK